MKSPTVNELLRRGGYAVETVVPKDDQHADPRAQGPGATDIIELPISKIVH